MAGQSKVIAKESGHLVISIRDFLESVDPAIWRVIAIGTIGGVIGFLIAGSGLLLAPICLGAHACGALGGGATLSFLSVLGDRLIFSYANDAPAASLNDLGEVPRPGDQEQALCISEKANDEPDKDARIKALEDTVAQQKKDNDELKTENENLKDEITNMKATHKVEMDALRAKFSVLEQNTAMWLQQMSDRLENSLGPQNE